MQKPNKKLSIGILMGGMSMEREVSFNSGRTVCDHINTMRYDVMPLFQTQQGFLYVLPWHFLHRGKIADFEERLQAEAVSVLWDDLKEMIDFMFIATHGRFAEDGTLQGVLEVLGIPYLGPGVLASALSMNRGAQRAFLRSNQISQPHGIVIDALAIKRLQGNRARGRDELHAKLQSANLSFPCIVKPVGEGSSLGVSKVLREEDLCVAVLAAATVSLHRMQSVVVEEFMEGLEFTCIHMQCSKGVGIDMSSAPVSREEWVCLPITEVCLEEGAGIYDYDQKYMPGRGTKITPARCRSEEHAKIEKACFAAVEALGLMGVARIDGFLTHDGRVVIIDVNTISGLAPASFIFHQAAQVSVNHSQLISHIIETSLKQEGLAYMKDQTSLKIASQTEHSKKTITVLFGGDSNERETSLESGRNVCFKISSDEYKVMPIFVSEKMELFPVTHKLMIQNSTREIAAQLGEMVALPWSLLPEKCDFVFNALHGGCGENGSVQGMLDMLKMPYNGSGVLPTALCNDKYKTSLFLTEHGFDVPKNFLIRKEAWEQLSKDGKLTYIARVETSLGYPVILKPHDDGCSVYVSRVEKSIDLLAALETYFATEKTVALIEEAIIGTELTGGVIGNEHPFAFLPSQPIAEKSVLSTEEKFLPGAGENKTPADLPLSAQTFVQKTLERVYTALELSGCARIDCFYQNAKESRTGTERVVIFDVNTLPGLTPATCLFHQAAEHELRPMDLIHLIIKLGFLRGVMEEDTALLGPLINPVQPEKKGMRP